MSAYLYCQYGAIIGATVGGTAGSLIGHKMDKQAEEIKNTVPDANVERVGEASTHIKSLTGLCGKLVNNFPVWIYTIRHIRF